MAIHWIYICRHSFLLLFARCRFIFPFVDLFIIVQNSYFNFMPFGKQKNNEQWMKIEYWSNEMFDDDYYKRTVCMHRKNNQIEEEPITSNIFSCIRFASFPKNPFSSSRDPRQRNIIVLRMSGTYDWCLRWLILNDADYLIYVAKAIDTREPTPEKINWRMDTAVIITIK